MPNSSIENILEITIDYMVKILYYENLEPFGIDDIMSFVATKKLPISSGNCHLLTHPDLLKLLHDSQMVSGQDILVYLWCALRKAWQHDCIYTASMDCFPQISHSV